MRPRYTVGRFYEQDRAMESAQPLLMEAKLAPECRTRRLASLSLEMHNRHRRTESARETSACLDASAERFGEVAEWPNAPVLKRYPAADSKPRKSLIRQCFSGVFTLAKQAAISPDFT